MTPKPDTAATGQECATISAVDPNPASRPDPKNLQFDVTKHNSQRRMLAIAGLVAGVLAWPAFGIFFGHSLGDIFAEDPLEQARLVAQQQRIINISGATFLIFVPLAAWIAGRTYDAHRTLSLLTSISVIGLAVFLIGLMIFG